MKKQIHDHRRSGMAIFTAFLILMVLLGSASPARAGKDACLALQPTASLAEELGENVFQLFVRSVHRLRDRETLTAFDDLARDLIVVRKRRALCERSSVRDSDMVETERDGRNLRDDLHGMMVIALVELQQVDLIGQAIARQSGSGTNRKVGRQLSVLARHLSALWVRTWQATETAPTIADFPDVVLRSDFQLHLGALVSFYHRLDHLRHRRLASR
jgi:hypothetical protein